MKRASTGWKATTFKSRIASNHVRCLTGYAAKGRRITGKKPGNHKAICCPAALVAEAYGDR